MPHYKNGTAARIGDLVKGKGYNVKDESGRLKELVGIVIGVTPGAASCNMRLAHNFRDVPLEQAANDAAHGMLRSILVDGCRITSGGSFTNGKEDAIAVYNTAGTAMLFDVEYGQCDHFEKIDEPDVIGEGENPQPEPPDDPENHV